MNSTATNQEMHSASAFTENIENVYSPAADFARPIGRKPAAVIRVPVSIGIAVEVYAKVAASKRDKALLHLPHHHLDRDDGVVDQQAERDDQRAERDLVQVDVEQAHAQESDRQHQRNRQRHHQARTHVDAQRPVCRPSATKLTASTIRIASTRTR